MEAKAVAQSEPLPVDRVEERMIRGPAGQIRLRLYWPNCAVPVLTIVYFHGGGHVIGSLDTHDLIARNLAPAPPRWLSRSITGWDRSTGFRRRSRSFGHPSGFTGMPRASARPGPGGVHGDAPEPTSRGRGPARPRRRKPETADHSRYTRSPIPPGRRQL